LIPQLLLGHAVGLPELSQSFTEITYYGLILHTAFLPLFFGKTDYCLTNAYDYRTKHTLLLPFKIYRFFA
jgi:hypothetical protein